MDPRQSLLDEIRARAMSDEGISDEQAADYQARQQALMKIAERDGGPEAIRASLKPRAKPKAKAAPRAQQGDVRKAEPSKLEQMLTGRPTAVPASTAMRGMPMRNPMMQAAGPKPMPMTQEDLMAMAQQRSAEDRMQSHQGMPPPEVMQQLMQLIAQSQAQGGPPGMPPGMPQGAPTNPMMQAAKPPQAGIMQALQAMQQQGR